MARSVTKMARPGWHLLVAAVLAIACAAVPAHAAYFAKKLRQAAAAHIENAATLAAVDLQTVAKEAAAFAATTDPHADLQRVCDVGKDRPFVWFQADAHLAAALAANTTHPRVFDYKLEEMETQMGFSYYVQGELQGLMMPAGMKNKFCEVAATVWSSGAANVPANAQAYLARTLETAIKEIYALWHAHFVSMAELSSVLEGHDFERLKRPKLFAANHSRCNRTARFKHHLAPTITAVFPTFPGHFPFLVSAVQLAHQYQTLPPTFTVIPSGKLNLTHARRLLDAVMDGNAKAHGVIVIGATHKMDTTETRNAGGNIVHTRLVSWVDSDDQVAPQRFEMLRWVHYLTNSKFMLHHWQPTGAKGFQCGGEWFPGYMFEAKPMVIEHQYGMDGRDLPWVAIAHRHCFTPADFLGVRMQNMLPKYQLNKPAADPLYGSVDGKHHPGYGRAYKYIVKYTGRNCASSHPTVTRRLFDVMQFREGYAGNDDQDFINKGLEMLQNEYNALLFLEIPLTRKCAKRSTHGKNPLAHLCGDNC